MTKNRTITETTGNTERLQPTHAPTAPPPVFQCCYCRDENGVGREMIRQPFGDCYRCTCGHTLLMELPTYRCPCRLCEIANARGGLL